MRLLGITWSKSVLVSFDPTAGAILEIHAWLKPTENFVGLTYDANRNLLYALSQINCHLYSIDPLTRHVRLIGPLNTGGRDVSGLAYDPVTDTLYTVVLTPGTTFRSDLAIVNVTNATITIVGKIADGLSLSLCWRESDGLLNSYLITAVGAWDSPFKASVITIDPASAAMSTVFQTAYHTILGLARIPGQNAYVSWVNWTSHFYGRVNLNTQTITQLGNSDLVGVSSAAMMCRSFYVAPAPNLPPCSFEDDDCLGNPPPE
jgi:hypothetical protein